MPLIVMYPCDGANEAATCMSNCISLHHLYAPLANPSTVTEVLYPVPGDAVWDSQFIAFLVLETGSSNLNGHKFGKVQRW